ncbi:helix-turn-helix domain-containing protein [Sphingomonas kyeonggiensis]|uniref:AraC-like DNA-binding protein n=1 Tax=Sphingomonas kyeonggiensis TaxID=1268553 RepID=A0A7W6JWZ2_9SPHN|nr:helix-turn-helix transcriptional regulator [Sphingomonas kyeonggiensis]MBB4100976.1 AraC-like DNA-binding protein [Sphingomonas kyeonggiensis]
MTDTLFTAMLIGMGLAAGLALLLRRRDQPKLGAALTALAAFELLLALLLLPDTIGTALRLGGAEVLALPFLPGLLRRYIDGLTGGRANPRDWLWTALAGALLLPFLSLPVHARDALFAGRDPGLAGETLLFALASVVAFWLATLAITLVSAVQILARLRRHRARLAAVYSTRGRGSLRGFTVMAALVGAVFLGQLANMIAAGFGHDLLSGWSETLFLLLAILGFAWHGLVVEPPFPDWAEEALAPAGPATPEASRPAYARSGLTDGDLDRILERLDRVMDERRLWSDSMLTLKELADAASVRPGYLSQALNQRRRVSFFDYVNGWRIDAAAHLLADTDRTVLAIAQDTGFNAKSTFNAAFRKAKGSSPSSWRLQKNGASPTGLGSA